MGGLLATPRCGACGEPQSPTHPIECRRLATALVLLPTAKARMSTADWLASLIPLLDGVDLIMLSWTSKGNRRVLYWPPTHSAASRSYLWPPHKLRVLLDRLHLHFLPQLLREHNIQMQGSMLLQALMFNIPTQAKPGEFVNRWGADIDLVADNEAQFAAMNNALLRRGCTLISGYPARSIFWFGLTVLDLNWNSKRDHLQTDMAFLDMTYDGRTFAIKPESWPSVYTRSAVYLEAAPDRRLYSGRVDWERVQKYQRRGFTVAYGFVGEHSSKLVAKK